MYALVGYYSICSVFRILFFNGKSKRSMQLHNKINRDVLKEQLAKSHEARVTISFYKYWHIADPQTFRDELYTEWLKYKVFGRTYVAKEGINAQISVPAIEFEAFKNSLYSIEWLDGLRLNLAVEDDGKSFYKLKIKVRDKIVADGLNDDSFDVTDKGKHLTAVEFNEITADPNTILVDMRNHYESEVGHFKGAVCPDVDTFREELPLVEEMFADQKDKNLVMYCTGGIRCEKASAYFKHKGFKNVFQLEGGIIKYARDVKAKGLENKFIGKNFVFDERLGERISEEVIAHCHQCGTPCDTHTNCANVACNLLFIQCPSCAEKYEKCCSDACKEITHLPEEEQAARRKAQRDSGIRIFTKGRFPRQSDTTPTDA